MPITWTFRMTENLLELRASNQDNFEYAANFEHSDIWTQIASQISYNCNTIVTGRQCQIKWNAMKQGYENICRILRGNPEGFPTHSPNLFDIEFFDTMCAEFWRPTNFIRRAYQNQRIDRRRYEHRERDRGRSRSRNRRRDRGRSRSRNRRRDRSRDRSRDRRRDRSRSRSGDRSRRHRRHHRRHREY